MKKIKSAAEIAMEKAQKIKGTREDAGTMEQEKYVKAATALAKSLLQNTTDADKIKETIERYPKSHKDAAVETFLGTVKAEIDLDNTPRILEAIMALKKDEKTRDICQAVQKLHEQYQRQRDETLINMEETATESMKNKLIRDGFSGSAIVGFNVKKDAQAEEVISGITKAYRDILSRTL